MDLYIIISIIIIILISLLVIILFYQWQIRKDIINSSSTTNTEELLAEISSVLHGIKQTLHNPSLDTSSDKYLVIDLAKSELEKSSLLIDKLQSFVENNNINNEQLVKLISIDNQMKSINNILISRYNPDKKKK